MVRLRSKAGEAGKEQNTQHHDCHSKAIRMFILPGTESQWRTSSRGVTRKQAYYMGKLLLLLPQLYKMLTGIK